VSSPSGPAPGTRERGSGRKPRGPSARRPYFSSVINSLRADQCAMERTCVSVSVRLSERAIVCQTLFSLTDHLVLF
jgi:hypothetical protein